MKKNIEKYLKENRLNLDVEEPDNDSVWEGIRAATDKKRNMLPVWFWKVAAIFIFFGFRHLFYDKRNNRRK